MWVFEMINGKKILTVIPARSQSKRLPKKNTLELCGKPLLCWPIESAKQSRYVDKVVVSTDHESIVKISIDHGAEAPFLRPSDLATDTASSASVVLHALSFFP